jgi:hypothetical protein
VIGDEIASRPALFEFCIIVSASKINPWIEENTDVVSILIVDYIPKHDLRSQPLSRITKNEE